MPSLVAIPCSKGQSEGMAVIPWALIPCVRGWPGDRHPWPSPDTGDERPGMTAIPSLCPWSGDGQGLAIGWRSPGAGDWSPVSGPLPLGMASGCPSAAQGMLQVRASMHILS